MEETSLEYCFDWKYILFGLPWWLSGKKSACNVGGSGSIVGWRRSLGEGNGNLAWEILGTEEPGRLQSMGS